MNLSEEKDWECKHWLLTAQHCTLCLGSTKNLERGQFAHVHNSQTSSLWGWVNNYHYRCGMLCHVCFRNRLSRQNAPALKSSGGRSACEWAWIKTLIFSNLNITECCIAVRSRMYEFPVVLEVYRAGRQLLNHVAGFLKCDPALVQNFLLFEFTVVGLSMFAVSMHFLVQLFKAFFRF